MCEQCDQEVEELRPIVDELTNHARKAVAEHDSQTPTQNIVGCANTILHIHTRDDGVLTSDAVRSIAVEYATVVMRLLALEQLSGICSSP